MSYMFDSNDLAATLHVLSETHRFDLDNFYIAWYILNIISGLSIVAHACKQEHLYFDPGVLIGFVFSAGYKRRGDIESGRQRWGESQLQ